MVKLIMSLPIFSLVVENCLFHLLFSFSCFQTSLIRSWQYRRNHIEYVDKVASFKSGFAHNSLTRFATFILGCTIARCAEKKSSRACHMASNTKDTTFFFNSKTRLSVIFPYLILSNIVSCVCTSPFND